MESQNLKTELQYIIIIISNYSATQYAEMMIRKEKENFKLSLFNSKDGQFKEVWSSYHNYMRSTWHSDDNASLEQCIEASRMSKLNYYAEMVRLYTGWVKNGKLFVLNKKEGFVSFLFELEKEVNALNSKLKRVRLRTNYNPKEVDCIEDSISPEYFNEKLVDDDYEISKNEKDLNEKCDIICGF